MQTLVGQEFWSADGPNIPMNQIRVLIVDEHIAVRQALAARLQSYEHIEAVATARDFREGLRRAGDMKPDVVLLELKGRAGHRPDMVGEMRRALAEHASGIIVLTSYADDAEREEALRAGANRYLLKHIDSARLLAEIEAVAAEVARGSTESEPHGRNNTKMKQQQIKDWMSREVITVSPDTPLPEAHRLMTENKIRRLPVVKDGRLVGIITRGDVRGAEPSEATSLSIWELNYLLARLKVQEIMTPDPITVSPESTINFAARLMLDNKISGLPVVDAERRIVGIITESDIFRLVVDGWINE